ncbi:hypothetical protein [Deinococcus ruber]|uniref:Uncharacterized protein n=1 Tax=Deinococcus ruber TaxID=1848197 RepID=A0A918CN23_9DEIO|nr:hypothetical protein [Deinococcus ruber]GGR31348.1 hypothetical protein GCM10008957_47550 [Deinococcus ruber]
MTRRHARKSFADRRRAQELREKYEDRLATAPDSVEYRRITGEYTRELKGRVPLPDGPGFYLCDLGLPERPTFPHLHPNAQLPPVIRTPTRRNRR